MNNKKYFINLTNHPSVEWGEEQLRAAEAFGEIVDMPFPVIDPESTSEEVNILAEMTIKQIRSLNANPVVHVMGEMTFTYALVFRLKALGIRCMASTTVRTVRMMPGGKKISEFKFVQVRDY